MSIYSKTQTVRINTSNQGKQRELAQFFAKHGCTPTFTGMDLAEIRASPLEVVVHKATQVDEGVCVEDTSLEIPGEAIGVDVRWLIHSLATLQGKPALWSVLLAQRQGEEVTIYRGVVHGHLTKAQGNSSFGFDPYFIPKGYTKTLAVEKPDACNARALAVEAFVTGKKHATHKALWSWQGPWQNT